MKVIKKDTIQSKEALFVGFEKGAHVGLIHDPDAELSIGEGFGHLAVSSPQIYDTCAKIKADGGKVTREAGPVKGGTTEIAFVEAPGGWKYELINRDESEWTCPMLHLMVRVGDLEKASKFYSEVFGMEIIRESVNEAYKYTLKFVGPGREEENTVFEFTYNWGTTNYKLGNAHAFTELTITTGSLEDVSSKVEQFGGKILEKNDKNFLCTDNDGYTLLVSKE
eukprot:TRINITY_DN12106_c0_g1_i1.p1 TRINITY_DN12106_c0_g1~~TRINITY_DN12106_c0_g1_i1.p1  ORF type:complete len:257 (+),score=64.89 TRINITY_DN12106_c0_g1_i1:105-773(+)